jgi:hypothetical protein
MTIGPRWKEVSSSWLRPLYLYLSERFLISVPRVWTTSLLHVLAPVFHSSEEMFSHYCEVLSTLGSLPFPSPLSRLERGGKLPCALISLEWRDNLLKDPASLQTASSHVPPELPHSRDPVLLIHESEWHPGCMDCVLILYHHTTQNQMYLPLYISSLNECNSSAEHSGWVAAWEWNNNGGVQSSKTDPH